MSRTITQRELRNDSGAILREVQADQTITVTRNGIPVAELRAVPQRRFVLRAVMVEAARRVPRSKRGSKPSRTPRAGSRPAPEP